MNNIFLIRFLEKVQKIMVDNKDYLINLDSIVGDSDLGLTMSDGFTAAYEAIKDGVEKDTGKLLYNAGKAMSVKVPSTMGTLMASGLMQAGKTLKGKTELTNEDMVTLFESFEEGVQKRGKAVVGEKTFLDGIDPAVKALKAVISAGGDLRQAANQASAAAETGFHNTTTMVAVHGRAATRGENSKTLEDPGAAVAMLLMQAFADSL